ncbi:MAG TPA: hypothetical protein VHS99_06900, partial [Chloroflexota bacterium]|nr:hypothetical protein [Chloroflexota bacterium]
MARPGPAIGLLWGAFPWDEPVRKVGKLYSMGAVGRTVTRALERCGRVIPYARAPEGAPAEAQRAALASFMQQIDVLWADVYPGSGPALELRQSLGLRCPAVLFAAGAMPKAAEAMLFPWQHLLRRGDGLWLSCEADRAIWHRLVRWSALHEWVVPLAVDDTRFRPRPAAERQAARRAFGLPATAPLVLQQGAHLLGPGGPIDADAVPGEHGLHQEARLAVAHHVLQAAP